MCLHTAVSVLRPFVSQRMGHRGRQVSEKVTASNQDRQARASRGATASKSQDAKRAAEEEEGGTCRARHRAGVWEVAEGGRGSRRNENLSHTGGVGERKVHLVQEKAIA